MQASMIIKGQGEIVTTGFRSPGGDFVLIEIANNGNSLSVQVPNSQIIAFHAAMVDALAPHVDEQRLAREEREAAAASAPFTDPSPEVIARRQREASEVA